MKNTEYHVTEVKANLNPTVGDKKWTGTHLDLEIGEGTYDEEEDWIQTEATLELNLYSKQDHEDYDESEDEEFGDPSYGSIEVDAIVRVSDISELVDEEVDIDDEMEKWEDGNYQDISSQIIAAIEVCIVPELIAPIDQLVDNSFFGILPLYVFTTANEEHEEETEE